MNKVRYTTKEKNTENVRKGTTSKLSYLIELFGSDEAISLERIQITKFGNNFVF